MSPSSGSGAARPEEAAASVDSPKPHGDKLASVPPRLPGEGPRGGRDGGPGDAQPSTDSPNPHGDKLGSVRGAAAQPGDQREGGA
jgi:hypothetical protein